MTTLEDPRPLAAANLLLVAVVFLVLGVALFVAVSRKKTWCLPLARVQFDSPTIKQNVSKAPMPIRFAFIILLLANLGLILFATLADSYFPIHVPDWWGRVWLLMQAALFLASCLLINRDRELARCGFTVVIFVILVGLFAPA